MKNILVAEDETAIREFVVINLERAGYNVTEADCGEAALETYEQKGGDFDIAILDIMMPEMDGIRTLLKLREEKNLPVILLSAKSEDSDKIFGLTAGADDYVTKPFNPSELVARVKSQLRRYTVLGSAEKTNGKTVIEGLVIDNEAKSVSVDGDIVRLTPIEFKILELLAKNRGRVFSADEIYRRVWNEDTFINDSTIAVHIRHIREKIEINPKEPHYLKVVWGVGYRIE